MLSRSLPSEVSLSVTDPPELYPFRPLIVPVRLLNIGGGGGGGGGGAVTVNLAVPFLPSTDALIVVEPAFTPLAVVAVPDDGLTVATVVLLLVHVKVLPVIRTLSESKARAVKRRVSPSSIDAVDGDTVTRSTTGGGSVTVSMAVSDLPSTDARIVVEPAFRPLAKPDELMVATEVRLLVHLKFLPDIISLSSV